MNRGLNALMILVIIAVLACAHQFISQFMVCSEHRNHVKYSVERKTLPIPSDEYNNSYIIITDRSK